MKAGSQNLELTVVYAHCQGFVHSSSRVTKRVASYAGTLCADPCSMLACFHLLLPEQAEEEAKRTLSQAAQVSQGRLQPASSVTGPKRPYPANSHQQADSGCHQQPDSSNAKSYDADSAAPVLATERETNKQLGCYPAAQTPPECGQAQVEGETGHFPDKSELHGSSITMLTSTSEVLTLLT